MTRAQSIGHTGPWPYKELDNDDITYIEHENGFWCKYEYDDNGNQTYCESSEGNWRKYKYDDKGNKIYYEDSKGNITKYKYTVKYKIGELIYPDDGWVKMYYNINGLIVKKTDSFGNVIE